MVWVNRPSVIGVSLASEMIVVFGVDTSEFSVKRDEEFTYTSMTKEGEIVAIRHADGTIFRSKPYIQARTMLEHVAGPFFLLYDGKSSGAKLLKVKERERKRKKNVRKDEVIIPRIEFEL
jgi:hypothetical protein